MRDVARVAGVSVATVGNVLHRPEVVATATRERVRAAMSEVGFVPSGPARHLRGVPSPLVGVVLLDVGNPFYAELSRGIEDRLAEAGCVVLACSTDVQVGRETRALQLLEEQSVRGIILTPVDQRLRLVGPIAARGTPVVLLDHPTDAATHCGVSVDHHLGGALAGRHLIGLGHRRIAFLSGATRVRPVLDRLAGVATALAEAGVDPTCLVEFVLPPPSEATAADAAMDRLMAGSRPPTAIICLNDSTALGVLRGLTRLGVAVPADVSVVGYDDLPFAAQLAPALTTVRQPTRPLGATAADLLLAEGQPGHRHQQVLLPPTLIARASTAAAATH
jgi:LacI family transcriptional regulator